MTEPLKKLPIGFQTFLDIIIQDRVYVDKTAYIAEMISGDVKAWFLSRPRRFGKSLSVKGRKSWMITAEDRASTGRKLQNRDFQMSMFASPQASMAMMIAPLRAKRKSNKFLKARSPRTQ